MIVCPAAESVTLTGTFAAASAASDSVPGAVTVIVFSIRQRNEVVTDEPVPSVAVSVTTVFSTRGAVVPEMTPVAGSIDRSGRQVWRP